MRAALIATAMIAFSAALPLNAQAACSLSQPNGKATAGPLTWQATEDAATPVLGTDGLIHLAYSTIVTNTTSVAATQISIHAIDPSSAKDLQQEAIVDEAGQTLTGRIRQWEYPPKDGKAVFADTLGPGQSGATYLDITFHHASDLPCGIALRITNTGLFAGTPKAFDVTGPTLPVRMRDPLVLAPPLRGQGWLDGDGCCQVIGGHRGVLNPIDGQSWPAEQFAIDFVRLDSDGRLFHGDMSDLKNWPFYGTDILAARGGKVVQVVDRLPDEVPGKPLPAATIDTAAGNSVIIDMGQGYYALYAHLKPGSLVVHVGDTVQTGQRLGALGNSGNSDAPHLHFQVMDRPSALVAVGLPFVFERMGLQGHLTGPVDPLMSKLMGGTPLSQNTTEKAREIQAMPLTLDILDFH